MKLKYRLYLAFGALLLCVLVVTALSIYPLLFNTLVQNQREVMKRQGELIINNTDLQAYKTNPAEVAPAMSVMPSTKVPLTRINLSTIIPLNQMLQGQLIGMEKLRGDLKHIPDLSHSGMNEEDYIVETVKAAHVAKQTTEATRMVILSTPYSEIEKMQKDLFLRMMLILAIGGIIAFLLSMLITKKIVTPLTKLKEELKKVKNRQFADVQWVKSGGEIGEVSRSVCELAAELGSYNRAQKQFFQNASHELKTPLMSIQGYAEGIRDGVFIDEHANKGLDVIASECDRLKRIVTEMTLLAKLESEDGIFEPSDLDVPDLLEETIERLNPLLLQKGLEVKVLYNREHRSRLLIQADHEKLLQAFLNIVGNAIRHAKHRIVIYVTIHNGSINIEVTDDGDGIPSTLLPHLFQRFIKGKNGENGLGLAISRAIVERCRGDISAYNLASGGAAFVMKFPAMRRGQVMLM
ncbi:HAMP domain-containing histidine kinase [Paenibacillus sp. N1-5-1-14]|uniref:sensor histidine kinase n=1 Tax=Paenibacillus radicibacter TaxID=2972488 RepID=UPI00215990EF|nr:HAMP domain-containing sensor histidine kinase [Paenibacillus radicibacter]MCR8643172.1 HAMP domain-containing histidine kinase [Paenibacillus radicibacter]